VAQDLDSPVVTDESGDVGRGGLLGGQAGDGLAGLAVGAAALI
jgi:hypothetical protein